MTATDLQSTDLQLISGMRLFASATEAERTELAASTKHRTFARGEAIYHQDDPPGSLYIVSSGTVKMQITSPEGKQMTIAWQGRGRFFGTISIFSQGLRPEDAIAIEPSDLLVIERDVIRDFLTRHPESVEVLFEAMAARWRHVLEIVCDLAFLDVPARVAKTLLSFSRSRGEMDESGAIVIHHMTQPELASLVSATRESVHNSLTAFSKQGWIECHRGSIRILKPEGLKEKLA